jgi:Ser/Thr protein kinase RdoA (MazF antagonist)
MTPEEQAALCEAYRLGKPLACEPLGGTRNRNFRLQTSGGTFVVRDRYTGYRNPGRIAFDHDAMAFLHQHEVAVVPPVARPGGETAWQVGDRMWEVFAAVDGRHYRDADASDARALAKALACFHRVGRDFERDQAIHKLGPRGETEPAELRRLIAQLRQDAPAALPLYDRWIEDASSVLTDSAVAALPHTLIHGDVQPANILIHAGRVSALVDLDWCDWLPRIHDLAFAVLLCCASHDSPIDGGDIWSLSQSPLVRTDLVRDFLGAYDAQGWPLSAIERCALQPQVMLSWCHCRLAGAMKVEPARRREFLERPPHDPAALYPDGIT